jgi:hypothetical protein
MPTTKELQHKSDATSGLWCIDRNPSEVDYEWIKRNAFQVHDDFKRSNDGISIGAFTLKPGSIPGKLRMISPSGEQSDIDAKVVEDLLRSFF